MFRARNDLDIILGKRRRILGRMVGSCIVGVTYRREYGSCIEGMGVTYRRDRHSRQDGRELHRRSHLPTGIRELHRKAWESPTDGIGIPGRMVGIGVTVFGNRPTAPRIEGMAFSDGRHGSHLPTGSAFSAGWSGAASSESPTDGNTGAASKAWESPTDGIGILGRMVGSCIVGVTYRREYGSCIEGMGVTYRRDRHSRQDGRDRRDRIRESTDGAAHRRHGILGREAWESPTDGNTGVASKAWESPTDGNTGAASEGMVGVTYRRDRHSRQDGRESTDGGGFGRYRRESDGFP